MRFIHAADLHLGYQQYGSKERFNDFSKAFLYIADQAISRQVDFVLLAGDLFNKRTVDPLAMRVAIEGLTRLRNADIPVIAVEGNHESAHYRDQYSWLEFLDALGYLRLLNPRFIDGCAVLEPHGDEGGAYIDVMDGIRVFGIKYYGASITKALGLFTDALPQIDHSGVDFTILLSHAGLEGQLPRYSGTITHSDLAPLRERINYLALGHIHKPYAADGWIYNPGSAETWNMEEVAWPERGYYLVEVQPGADPDHQAELVATPRRPFHRLRVQVDTLTEPNAVYDAVRALLRRERDRIVHDQAPVIELTLGGVLPFSRYDLDLTYVQSLLEEAWSPLVARVQNRTTPAEFEIAVDVEASRPELERSIIRDLLERDARFRATAGEWTRVALDVKRMSLEGSPPEAVIDVLRRSREELAPTRGEE